MSTTIAAGLGVTATTALAIATVAVAWGRPPAGDLEGYGAENVLFQALFVCFAMIGGLVAARRPRNPAGWLTLLSGIAMTAQIALEEYVAQAIVLHPGSLPLGSIADWAAEWVWVFLLATLQFTPLLFPDGRLPSRRWRWFVGLVVAGDIVLLVALPVALWPLRGRITTSGDAFVEAGVSWLVEPLAIVLVGAIALSLLSLVQRYRRADRTGHTSCDGWPSQRSSSPQDC